MNAQNIKGIKNHITAKTTNLKSPNKEITKKTIIRKTILTNDESLSSLDGGKDIIFTFDNDFSSLQMKNHNFNESEFQSLADSNWEDYIIHIACGDDIGIILREILLIDDDNPIKDIRKHLDRLCINDASNLDMLSEDIEKYEENLQKRRESIMEIEIKIMNQDFASDEEYFMELKNLENKIKELDYFRTSSSIGKKLKSIENNKDSFISYIRSNKSYEIYMCGLIKDLQFVLNHI